MLGGNVTTTGAGRYKQAIRAALARDDLTDRYEVEAALLERRQPTTQGLDGHVVRVADRDRDAAATRDPLGLEQLATDVVEALLVVEEHVAHRERHAGPVGLARRDRLRGGA